MMWNLDFMPNSHTLMSAGSGAGGSITELLFQLAIILVAAKAGGELFQRFIKMPPVLGELTVGIIIGPFALGGIEIAGMGPLFGHLGNSNGGFELPVSESLWNISQIGAIILLFLAGLETDLKQFMRYAKSATFVALGGVVVPFSLGVVLTVLFGFADNFVDVRALIMGALLTATSIGITVRVMGDLGCLSTPEGVTILGAAVLDDVIGILVLTIVVSLGSDADVSWGSIGFVAFKSIGFWIALMALGLVFANRIAAFIGKFQVSGSAIALSLALAFLAAGLSEAFGLATIIGAFSIGLALSNTKLAHNLESPLQSVYAFVVPVFFVVMGMLVDVRGLGSVLVFGSVLTIFAIIGKVGGSAIPALLSGFNLHGSSRIGIGMLPRGEVALIMAGLGVSKGLLDSDLYAVAIIMTIVTTAIATPALAFTFKRGGSGLRSTD